MNCKHCGNPLQEGSMFCNECGSKVENQQNFNPYQQQNVQYGNQQGFNPNQQQNVQYGNQQGFNPNQQQNVQYGNQQSFNPNQQQNVQYGNQQNFNPNQQQNVQYGNQQNFNPNQQPVGMGNNNNFTPQEINDGKVMSVLAYLGILVLIPIFAEKNNRFVRFHANQGLILFIASIASGVIGVIPYLGTLINVVVSIAVLVFAIIGIINACQGEAKELPLIGEIKILK